MAQAPTVSMEAYKYYLQGNENQRKQYFEDARKDFEKAIELDPQFALAYYDLSSLNQRSGNRPAFREAITKARELSRIDTLFSI
jgi:tetratricopeptide (TPR) repeat protein